MTPCWSLQLWPSQLAVESQSLRAQGRMIEALICTPCQACRASIEIQRQLRGGLGIGALGLTSAVVLEATIGVHISLGVGGLPFR